MADKPVCFSMHVADLEITPPGEEPTAAAVHAVMEMQEDGTTKALAYTASWMEGADGMASVCATTANRLVTLLSLVFGVPIEAGRVQQ